MAVRKPPAERPGTPLSNRNFLAPTGFKFTLKRSPAAAFFCNQANIPSMDLGVATQPTYLRDIPTPGDKIEFGDLSIRFLGLISLIINMSPDFNELINVFKKINCCLTGI